MKIIAHKITNHIEAKSALEKGVDFLEVDVSKRMFIAKFTTQHHGIKGKLGFGHRLEHLLKNKYKTKLFLDIKHARYSLNFANKFKQLLKEYRIKNIRICGRDWQIISQICSSGDFLAYYTISKQEDLSRLEKHISRLTKPAGFSVRYTLLNKKTTERLRKLYPNTQIWVWTVNNSKEIARTKKLKIDGIISDNWQSLIKKS